LVGVGLAEWIVVTAFLRVERQAADADVEDNERDTDEAVVENDFLWSFMIARRFPNSAPAHGV